MTNQDTLGQTSGWTGGGLPATECTESGTAIVTETRSVRRRTENIPPESVTSVHSITSAASILSVSSAASVHSVLRETLPATADGWRVNLFKFTRALKFDCHLDGTNMATIRPHVEQWYTAAAAVLGDVPFSEVWGAVVTSWERARRPAFFDPLADALASAREHVHVPPLPTCPGYDEPVVALAYRLLFWLAQGDGRFFVSCRALGERLEIDHTRAWRILRMFEADGVIECLKRGKRPKASRYCWNGTVASPSPGTV